MNIQIIISIVTMIASCGVAWGVVKQQLKQFDERLDALESDNKTNRELLIEIKTKVDLILEGTPLSQASLPLTLPSPQRGPSWQLVAHPL